MLSIPQSSKFNTLNISRFAAYIPSIVLERPVYLRETSDGMYCTITYVSYKILEELMVAIGMVVAFSLPVYYVIDLQVCPEP